MNDAAATVNHTGLLPAGTRESLVLMLALLLLQGAFGTEAVIAWFELYVGRNPVFFTRILVGVMTLVLVARFGLRRVWTAARLDPLLLALNGYTVLTIIWSIDRPETFTAIISLVLTTLLGIYIGARFSLREQIAIYTATLIAGFVASVLMALFVPSIGVMTDIHHVGRWNGLFEHKNQFGYLTTLMVVVLIYFPNSLPHLPRAARIGLLALALLAYMFAEALTAQLLTVGAVLVYAIYAARSGGPKYRVALLIGYAAIIFLAPNVVLSEPPWRQQPDQPPGQIVVLDRLDGDIGSDIVVTGRLNLWQSSLVMIAQRPVLGYGYLAPFEPESPIFSMLTWSGWRSAHNFALDIAMHIGLLGLLLLGVHYLLSFNRAARNLLKTRQAEWGYCAVFLVFIIACSMIDGNAFTARNMWWVMYVSFAITLRANRMVSQTAAV